jgi:hypothetical protein
MPQRFIQGGGGARMHILRQEDLEARAPVMIDLALRIVAQHVGP